MRKLLDEKFIFYKMSNRKLNENNKLFSKAESSSGCCEWTGGNNRNSGVSCTQKRRNKCEEKCKGSIDTNKSVTKNLSNSDKKSKSKKIDETTRSEGPTMYSNSLPDYPYVLCPQYSGVHMHRQQMFFSNLLTNGVTIPSYYVPNPNYFYRSLSESAVPCQQLSNVYFNSCQDRNGTPLVSGSNMSSCNNTINCIRSWQLTALGKALQKLNGGKNRGIYFKVMTYNVLAQDLLNDHPELYRDNDKTMLHWEIRWRNIYQDIKEQNCDIVCLQEVQANHLEKYYNTLKGLGYDGIYKQRTGQRTDGCAIYYRRSLFNLVEYTTVEYRQPIATTLLNRDNVGIVATFAPKESPTTHFVVATTHLLYNPRRQDVRLAQMQILLSEIERFAYRNNRSDAKYVPIILTGDLNTEPTSALYNFIRYSILRYDNVILRSNYATGKVLIPPALMITDNCQHAALLHSRGIKKKLTRKMEEKLIGLTGDRKKDIDLNDRPDNSRHKYASGTLSHNFAFKSVYKHHVNNDIEGTTFQGAWVTVDYIFYSGTFDESKRFQDDKLKLLSRFTLPTRQQLSNTKIPNFEQGSDHLALLACFKLEY